MKGVLKGFKYITQIFDEDKEREMQIGLPTDVKHVAHIGLDGPSTESPSWMNKFKGQEKVHSAPLDANQQPVQQRARSAPLDANGNSRDSSSQDTSRDMPNIPKASRRRYSADNLTIETKDLSSRSKGSRRHRRKDSSDGSINKSGRRRHQRKDSGSSDHEGSSSRSGRTTGYESAASPLPSPSSPAPRNLPDIPKSSRPRKPKDESSKSSKSKASSDNESNQTSLSRNRNPPLVEEEKREIVACPEGSA